jgi:hypothetical protein
MAGLTPGAGAPPSVPDDGNPDGPIMIPASTLSKLNLPDLQPGASALATVRVTISGTPDAPEAEITAVGEVRPDDQSADLTTLSDDSQQAPPDLEISGGDDSGEDMGDGDGGGDMPAGAAKVPQDDPYKSLGFSPKSPKKKSVSAKDVFGE